MAGTGKVLPKELEWDNGLHTDLSWYVNYTVLGMGEVEGLKCQAGPYPFDEIEGEYSDIRGYCGIVDCYKTTVKDNTRHNSCGQSCHE